MLIKIITLNIAHGKGMDGLVNIERQAELINTYKPDIVFLQEIDMYTKRAGERNQIREFSKKVYLPYLRRSPYPSIRLTCLSCIKYFQDKE